ncbi:hypothetical protein ACTUVJ_002665 [Stenotrophomonas indicatrix]
MRPLLDMSPHQASPLRAGTSVSIVCGSSFIQWTVPLVQAEIVSKLATVASQEVCSERELVDFVRDQVIGRDNPGEAELSKHKPEYADDVAYKVVLFALGLLALREDLAPCVHQALIAGDHAIAIDLGDAHLCVGISGPIINYANSVSIAGSHQGSGQRH